MQRLGQNLGRYHGAGIDIEQLRARAHRAALAGGWRAETFLEERGLALRAYHRPAAGAAKNIYLSTGIHGDEPSGPLALAQLLEENAWPEANLWLVPCLNPTGFPLNTRENAQGVDLNRDYRHLETAEISAHAAWLERQPPFDASLLLHEDWEANGFYVYELNFGKRPTLAEPIIEAVRSVCPIETAALVDDFECRGGIIRPDIIPEERERWAEALYLAARKSGQNYTLETPSDYPLELRVRAHLAAVRRALTLLAPAP